MNKTEFTEIKPLLRGHFHQATFFVALGACGMLVASATETLALVAALIYSLSLLNLYGTSALYHRPAWKPRMRLWMKRLDHSAIFILISGSITPIALLALPSPIGTHLLILTWVTTFIGIMRALFWSQAPTWLCAFIYLCAGWILVIFLPHYKSNLSERDLILLIAGGIVYTFGALVFAFKRPNPSARYFGYHEIFHIFVIIGSTLHFLVIDHLIK